MAISINGTTGIQGVDGTAAAPAIQGSDTDTGIVFGADTASISTAGTERLSVDATGNMQVATGNVEIPTGKIGIGTASPTTDIDLNGNFAANAVAITVDGSGVANVDCSLGNYFTVSISTNSFFTFNNVPANRSYSFVIEITHTGGTISWPSSVKFPNDQAPTLNTSKTHLFCFISDDGGSRFRSSALIDFVN
tara:strand:- start:101 stop:679 length:579 start_codon:yes stop_codon:yes gene_type:complete